MPRVSVILPFHNRAQTVRRCVESVRAQTFGDWELIAVDDGSTDHSAELLLAFEDPRIRLLRHEQNRGAAAARNTAIDAAAGEYVALIDSDDEWLPEKLGTQLAALDATDARLSSCAFRLIRAGQTSIWPKPFDAGSLEKALHRECTFGFGSTLVIQRMLALKLGNFDPDLPRHEDWDWVLRAFEGGEALAFVAKPLANVYAIDRIDLTRFIKSTHRFLAKHDPSFGKFGPSYLRKIHAYHFESVASMAYENRAYRTGTQYLLRSFATWPWRSPLPLAALPLSVIDCCFGTRWIQRGAELHRQWFAKERERESLPA